MFELCQVELGLHVVAAKRQEAGDQAMNESDHRQLRRAAFDTRQCALLRPETAPGAIAAEPATASGLPDVLERLQARGFAAYAIDLTRPQLLVPVVRVLAPALQLDPCEIVSTRLADAIAATGGGAIHHGGMPLL